ncbi:histidine-type phosphatase [Flavobacterium sp. ALJ2]|uniref:histidine-type phosphatase n=1 Tax=Flavobacterium sp. ALJ2 TaxID=2786960 RepID=UPI0018A015F7|nr:histidine-type phosphatase [Flavobacterium sp. ALJ2]MBF7091642.1 histidine-type phosphatase [Flavobacterium sp. ALJ2]
MKKNGLLFFFILANLSIVLAQATKQEMFDTPEKTAGVYYAYPAKDIVAYTPVPKGYEAFYISHFGRHGSRYLISDNDYKEVLDLFENGNKNAALTDLGKDVLKRLQQLWGEVEFRGGDLSLIGVQEQRGIAERMYNLYPKVFNKESQIEASATTIVRVALSMDAFCERMKEFNPSLQITRNSGIKWQRYLNYHTPEAIAFRSAKDTWKEEFQKFEAKHINPDRLINSLFSDEDYIIKKVNPETVMKKLFAIAGGMQNIETKLSFYDLFEKEELFDLWQCTNYRLYVNYANSAINSGIMFENQKPTLKNILENANKVIASKGKGATLRFAHDGNIIPLAMLLHLEGTYNSISDTNKFYEVWSDFKVAPMAGNIQIVFFRKPKSDDILVKFLLHEKEVLVPTITTDIAPYYNWKDVESYYKSLLAS